MKNNILFGFFCFLLPFGSIAQSGGAQSQGDSISIIVEEGTVAESEQQRDQAAPSSEAKGSIDPERAGFNIQISGATSPYKLRLINRENYNLEKQFELYEADTLLSQEFVDELPGKAYNIWVTDARKVKFQLEGILGQEPTGTPEPVEAGTNYTTLIVISILALGLLVFFLLFNKKRQPKTMFDE